ncbi:MAG: HDOD domain-containing protein [bacterium]|nr:HDOD domain-containing protein [bacterium]
MDTLESIKKRVKDMPSISSNTIRILELISDEDYSVKDLSGLISMDVSLATKCLKIVNSAKFGLQSVVTSIDRAVNYLGKQAIFGLVIESGFDYVFNKPLEGYNAAEGELWEHSLRTAIASRLLAIRIKKTDIADLAYTSGLLHNIGKVVMTEFLKGQTKKIQEKFKDSDEVDFSALEKKLLKTNHEEVGKMMGEKWGIPEPICMAIFYHHRPAEAPEDHKNLCYIVHLGDHFAMLSGCAESFDSLAYEVDDAAKKLFSFEDEEVESLMFDIELEVIHAKQKIFS